MNYISEIRTLLEVSKGVQGITLKDKFGLHLATFLWLLWRISKNKQKKPIAPTDFLPFDINVKTIDGIMFRVRRKIDSVYYREPILAIFKPNLGDTVVDIGANIGQYSILVSKMVGEKGKVLAIEPHPDTFKQLQNNIILNGASNVIPVNCAVWDKEGAINLYTFEKSVHSSVIYSGEAFISVNSRSLDEIVNFYGIDRIDWLKIDAEGAEVRVLNGAKISLNKTNRLIIEAHTKENFALVNELLKKYNFHTETTWETSYGVSYIYAQRRVN